MRGGRNITADMAESKGNRNSFAGKVATPKTAGTSTPPAQTLPDTMEALGKAIGARYVQGECTDPAEATAKVTC